jgi:small subunit ribosomal protein S8
MTDPISDMLSRIRNAAMAGHDKLICPRSQLKVEIAKILLKEGFIREWSDIQVQGKRKTTRHNYIQISLKYDEKNKSVVRGLKRISKPSRRLYVGKGEIPRVRNGLGIAILTTARGVLTDNEACYASVGGEVLCYVW